MLYVLVIYTVALWFFLGSVSEGGGRFSASEALRTRAGSKGHYGETEELQPHQR